MTSRSTNDADPNSLPRKKKVVSKPVASKRPQTSPELFTDSPLTKVVSSLPIWEASNILTQRKDLPWKADPDGKLTYSRDVNDGKGAICFWVADNLEEEHPAALASAAALAVIDTFDIRAACMHLIFAAHASQMDNPWEQEIVIDDRQLEAYLGLQRRTDKNRQEKLALIEEIAKQPCKITTFISWPSKGRKKGFTVEEGRLWHLMGTRYHYEQDIFGNKELAGITFVVKAGLWAKYFMNEEVAQEQGLPATKSAISKNLLESIMSIWQHRTGAARLMIWLLFKSQLTAQQSLSVRTLMEVAYGPEKVEDAEKESQLRKRMTNAWDEDLLTLHEQGWEITFDAATYPIEIRPSGLGRESERRPRGFFERLLQAHICVSLPKDWEVAQLEARLQSSTETNQLLRVERTITPDEIKANRTERGWSQRRLAGLTGISQGMISMMENGTRSVSEENDEKLRRVFEFM